MRKAIKDSITQALMFEKDTSDYGISTFRFTAALTAVPESVNSPGVAGTMVITPMYIYFLRKRKHVGSYYIKRISKQKRIIMKKYIILLIILAVAQLGYCQYMGSDDLITKTDSISKVSSVDFAYEGIFPPYTPNWQDDSLATHQQIANYFDILSGSYNSASFTVMAGYPKLVLGKVKPENFAGQGLSIPAASETQFGIMSFFHFSKLDTLFDDLTTNYLTKYNGTGLVNTNVQENATGVGIGKKPEYKLDVSGNINFDNNLYKNGVLIDFSSLFDTVQVGDIYLVEAWFFTWILLRNGGLTVATTYLDILPAGLSDVNSGPKLH